MTGAEPVSRAVRGALARLAREAALEDQDVVAVGNGPPVAATTDERGERMDGVACIAERGGHYEVTLYLTTLPVPLAQLAERARERVRRVAGQHGLGDRLGEVNLVIRDVVAPSKARGE